MSGRKFLEAAGTAAKKKGCETHEAGQRVVFTCRRPAVQADCERNLDGELTGFILPVMDGIGRPGFSVTYRGNAVETCGSGIYGPSANENAFFGVGFPDFLTEIRDRCTPSPPPAP